MPRRRRLRGGKDDEADQIAREALFIARTGVGFDGAPLVEQDSLLGSAVQMVVVATEGRERMTAHLLDGVIRGLTGEGLLGD